MDLIFADCDCRSLNAEIAGYAFEHTQTGDRLRGLMMDLVRSNGPFSGKSNLTREERERWVEMLAGGGEVIGCWWRGG
jgi:hypothetical protein